MRQAAQQRKRSLTGERGVALYLDVSELIGMAENSGIQRVVREIARCGTTIGAERGVEVVPVLAIGRRLYRLNDAGRKRLTPGEHTTPAPSLAKRGKGVATLRNVLRHQAAPLFSMIQKARLKRRLQHIARINADPQAIVPGPSDTLVLADAFWNGSSILDAAAAARTRGANVVLVVYDLIPIRQPHLVDAQLARVFPGLLDKAFRLSCGVVTISQQVTRDVLEHAGSIFSQNQVRHFYLGQNFEIKTEQETSESTLPFEWMTGNTPRYLMIGTIEPRRGHPYVLDAFDRLWAAGGEQRLMLIGKIGWQMDTFMERCAAHSRLGTHLFLLHGASDALLAKAMKTTDAVVMASYQEGFGLPLVEALLAKKPVLASDIAIFREIADETPLFFTVGDPASLANAVTTFERDPAPWRHRATTFQWLDWDQSAAMFIDIVIMLTDPMADFSPRADNKDTRHGT
jgi:alpha-1,2-rhamnosyltransferase